MISYKSAPVKCTNRTFNAIIKHVLNTYNTVNLEKYKEVLWSL